MPHANTTCFDGKCEIIGCEPGFVDCDEEPSNGCEASLDNVEHCGQCNAACRFANAVGACVDGRCEFDQCDEGHGDCDEEPDNGCEVPLTTTVNCGACGVTCPAPPNALAGCVDGECGVGACMPGFGDCDAEVSNGCETRLNSLTHCAACDVACAPPNGSGDCAAGACTLTACDEGFVDCNGLAADGCEATLDTPQHCGACGARCELPNAAVRECDLAGEGCRVDHSCDAGDTGCEPGEPTNGCDQGFADCDGVGRNGCERPLTTLSDCGACGAPCQMPHALASCATGDCAFVACDPGYDACGGSATCQAVAGDPVNCGRCGNLCPTEAPGCHGGVCTDQSCPAGRADCNGDPADGCETSLGTTNDCAICGHACAAASNATVACQAGECVLAGCAPGFEDCDGDYTNGCEEDLRSANNCGACGQPCIVPHAQADCSTGRCELTQCNPGRADCNATDADGCETDLSLPATCGACDADCRALPQVLNSSCDGDTCKLVCAAGRGDCDGDPLNGCEASLASSVSCGACGNNCSGLPHVVSARCDGGMCVDLVCEVGWDDCDGDRSNGCERSTRTSTDCGDCDLPCSVAHGEGTCTTGRCLIDTCDTGFADCNSSAADGCEVPLASSQDHCGACGSSCAPDAACLAGVCTCNAGEGCGPGEECCDGTCVMTQGSQCYPWPCVPGTRRDPANCGACGRRCGVTSLWCCASLAGG